MDILQYSGLKAALEAQGCRAKWPNQIKGKMHQKFRKALLMMFKDEGWREIPRLADVDNILKEAHEPGHGSVGQDKMKVKLGTQYYWNEGSSRESGSLLHPLPKKSSPKELAKTSLETNGGH